MQRKRPAEGSTAQLLYWYPALRMPEVVELLAALSAMGRYAVIFGEVYGPGVRSFHYGVPKGQVGFRVFDLRVNGTYLPWSATSELCRQHGVATALLLYQGPFDLETVRQLSEGDSTVGGVDHIREGVVVRPVEERTHPAVGRVILKMHNADYIIKRSAGKIADYTDE